MLANSVYKKLLCLSESNKKQVAVLIDPDSYQDTKKLKEIIAISNDTKVDYIFVGGSLLTSGEANIKSIVTYIKKETTIPCVLFPGSSCQVVPEADAILFLSLISGRNPQLLIGEHITAAPLIYKSNIETIPTGYILIDSGQQTTAIYVSNTAAIPYQKDDIASITALAGTYLGLKVIFLDVGSGANKTVSTSMVKSVKSKIKVPLIVGGGIKSVSQAKALYQAGANILVIGNLLEKSPENLNAICKEAR